MKRLTVFRFLIGLALLCAGALTPYAQASFPEIFVVNSTGDGDDAFPGDGQCETAVGNGVCTLRAAIEETNAHAGGDGIYNRAGGTINIINSELTATSADGGNGGCIYNSSTGTIHVTNSYLSDSYASANGVTGAGNGGAVYNAGTMTITNTTIYLFDADLTNGGRNPGGNGGR